jgi:hypothetical protein
MAVSLLGVFYESIVDPIQGIAKPCPSAIPGRGAFPGTFTPTDMLFNQ